ncbi:MAG: hypothetical protein JNN32_08980 [Flavobacteriales bacterium]|nr:hypothetical protein [Flavobacteriales bacterium]
MSGDLLKDLFHEAGLQEAPADLEKRVLAQLAKAAVRQPSVEAPLVPRWAWTAAIGLCTLLLLLSGAEGGQLSMPALPALRMGAISPWILGSLFCAALLFALDTALRLRSTSRVR